jgi:HSP20 family protein
MNLVPRESLFRDLFDFRRDFDQMLNRMVTWPWGQEATTLGETFNFVPAVESYLDKDGKKYFCRLSLPGIEPKDVHIHALGNTLTITGERKFSHSTKEVDFQEKEIAYGSFERELTMPEGVNIDKLTAEYVNGVLEITAPIAATALPRKIEIKTVPFSKQIAA